jgi:hypothetical protein
MSYWSRPGSNQETKISITMATCKAEGVSSRSRTIASFWPDAVFRCAGGEQYHAGDFCGGCPVPCTSEMVDENLDPPNLPASDWPGFRVSASVESGTSFAYALRILATTGPSGPAQTQAVTLSSSLTYAKLLHDRSSREIAACSERHGKHSRPALMAHASTADTWSEFIIAKSERRCDQKQRPIATMRPILDRLDQLGEPYEGFVCIGLW